MSYASDALIDALKRDVDRLKRENSQLMSDNAKLRAARDMWAENDAKLREERHEYQATIDSLVDECSDHKAENTKLRELIADVHESLKADKAEMFHNLTLSAMEDDMRELGIEVD